MTEPTIQPENLKFQIEKPFGPSIGRCKLPPELIDDFNKDCNNIIKSDKKVKDRDWSHALVGNVTQELTIDPEVFKKWTPYFEKMLTAYVQAHGDDPATAFTKLNFKAAWYVRTFAGDFNPSHYHTNCHISSVGYLTIPEGLNKEQEQKNKAHAGGLEIQFGQCQLFSVNTVRVRPEVGDFFIFPWWMRHMVYPFKTKGERRSFSFNTELEIKK